MLLNLTQLIKKHRLQITGVVHVGAHFAEEFKEYKINGVNNIHFIEPCEKAFNYLFGRFGHNNQIKLYNVALGNKEGRELMYIETANRGQSNSLLKPAKHLEQYPNITFNKTESVQVVTLDSLGITDCNFINMDVQGYELEVLKGGTETLKNIKYIYTEVNRDEVYEGCARIEQLDEFLSDFERVETDFGGGTWGDALYIRKSSFEAVPNEFKPHIKHNYPEDNHLIFEEWFSGSLTGKEDFKGYTFLPIHWTSYYVNNGYGKNYSANQKLQRFINLLPKDKKYFTINQFDDGILNDLSKHNIKVFCMAGHGIDIPLVSQPHRFQFSGEKKYLANFIGKHTHPIREEIFKIKRDDFYISDKPHSLEQYCKIISESYFTLCPRGYGATSFRIQEAVQYGSIPVYISDKHVMSHEMHDCVLMAANSQEAVKFIHLVQNKELHDSNLVSDLIKHFTYESLKQSIINQL